MQFYFFDDGIDGSDRSSRPLVGPIQPRHSARYLTSSANGLRIGDIDPIMPGIRFREDSINSTEIEIRDGTDALTP